MLYYDIPSEACISPDTKIVEEQSIEAETSGSSGLKILFIVLWWLVGIFVILIVIFAIKAKMNREDDDEE